MSTFEQMRSRIADDINRADLNTQIEKAINRSIEHYEKEWFWFNEASWSFSTTSSTEVVTMASASTSDLMSILNVTLTRNSSDIYPLKGITFQELREKATTGSSHKGPPIEYAFFDNNFYFYPVPDQNYTVTIYGKKGYANLSASGDTNDFTTEGEDLIEARSRWWVCKRILKDVNGADLAKAEELEALQGLRDKTDGLVSTGTIRPHD
jgi:hypothetical protein